MTLLIVIMNDAERNASRGLVLLHRHTATARTPPLPDLPEELIMEILLRLLARTLVFLRSVCTSWRNLISSPDFTCNHLYRSCLRDPSLTPPRIAYYTHSSDYRDLYGVIESFSVQSILDNPSEPAKVDYFSGQRYHRMVGSCHGLLCFFYDDGGQNTHGILWNPCTGFTFQSPQISGQATLCGFGYDHLSDSYKLFGIIRKKVPLPSGLEFSSRIYTFGPTSSWRKIDDIPLGLLGVPTDDLFMPDNMEGMKEYGNAQPWTKLAIIPFHPQLVNLGFPLQSLYISESDVLLAISPSLRIVLFNLNDGSIDLPVIDGTGDGMEN
ncbi:F-box/kelch-repeat protein At3g23880-like [Arachis ipaensis]|uniref:F-box domain-containing protein n=2 Tax=Arachis hypogaea TaxID=3818 RepID=A0A444XGB8_ARAHY|nr:F-box/kelch-repeat protein At3g23880-like [Arachis ipaensis]RYQ88742.1 hypothetical protein Ahy_B09g095755 isoform A [Arachis hypogaea]